MIRLTAEQIIDSNKKIIAENNLKTWDEIHVFVLQTRLENKETN